jgi:hypothetical protein
MLKEIEDKKAVRAYEDSKSKGGNLRFMSEPAASGNATAGAGVSAAATLDAMLERDSSHTYNHELDALWQNIRNFFDDLTEKGDKREIGKGDRSNKLKFMEAC